MPDAIHYSAMGAVKVRIDALTLSPTPAVDVRWLPRAKPGDTFPIIAVTPVNAESFPGIMTATDDIGLPIAVTILDAQNQDPTLNLNRNLLWRQTIISALRYQRLAGVPEGYILMPEPGMIIHSGFFNDENLFFSPMFFRLITRTARG